MNASVNAARARSPNQAHGRDCDHHPSRDDETLLGSATAATSARCKASAITARRVSMPNCRYPACLGAASCCANQQRAAGINRGLGLGKTPSVNNHITRGFCRRRDQVVRRLLDLDGVIIANLDRRRVRKPLHRADQLYVDDDLVAVSESRFFELSGRPPGFTGPGLPERPRRDVKKPRHPTGHRARWR